MQAFDKTRGLLKLHRGGALRKVAGHHHHRHAQPLRQPLSRRTHRRIVCTEVQIREVHQNGHRCFQANVMQA